MIKVSYDENFKVTGIGDENAYETTEPFILLDLTDEEFDQLLEIPFKTLVVNTESEEIVSVETLEEPMEEITVEDLRRENEELKVRLERLESLLYR
ncbi:MAG: hypothetical protein SO274_06465 [Turicibacter bilis]|nr:hypothetical protein [Turicibacter bilis]